MDRVAGAWIEANTAALQDNGSLGQRTRAALWWLPGGGPAAEAAEAAATAELAADWDLDEADASVLDPWSGDESEA